MVPGFGLGHLDSPQPAARYAGQPSPPPYTVASGSTFGSDPFELRPTKRQRLSQSSARSASIDQSKPHSQTEAQPQPSKPAPAPTKSKRVRTGCLTCRERHLKCDEATPDCLNCRKSNRECKRGVRLNFIDVQVKTPPYLPPSDEWIVQFQDESRLIASEYQGGLIRYAGADQALITPPRTVDGSQPRPTAAQKQQKAKQDAAIAALALDSRRHSQPQLSRPFCSPQHIQMDGGFEGNQVHARHNSEASLIAPPSSHSGVYGMQVHDHFGTIKEEPRGGSFKESPISTPGSMVTNTAGPPSSFRGGQDSRHPSPPDGLMTPPQDSSACNGDGSNDSCGPEVLTKPNEVMYMQLFVEDVGPWMDSMDRLKYFSQIIPYRAARSPMLLNAILACGVRHLTLVQPDDKNDSIALVYYNTASTLLLRNLQNPDRDMVECATTACVLNVFEIMSERPAERMNHIAGARALIKECGWNARSRGIGAACFWLNVGMEVLSCLSFNWKCSWDPDQWGVDMDFGNGDKGEDVDGGDNTGMAGEHGGEEIWVHRIFYVLGKIANFKASIPRFQEACPLDEQMRVQARYADWQKLKALADKWNSSCPRTMRPFGYVPPSKGGKSKFPNVWLIKRPAVIGRVFYHTAQCLLAQINPLAPRDSEPTIQAATHHARQVCGIAAHTKDRGVASISIRPLAIASSVLKDREEQAEVLAILDKIHSESGWRLGKVHTELKKAWGWEGPRKSLAPIPAATGSGPANGSNTGGNPLGAPSACAGNPLPAAASGGLQAAQSRTRSVASSPSLRQQQEDQRAQARQHQQQQIAAAQQLFGVSGNIPLSSVAASVPAIAQPTPKVPVPITQLGGDNPLVAADFRLPNHPYGGFYQPPTNRAGAFGPGFFLIVPQHSAPVRGSHNTSICMRRYRHIPYQFMAH